jgi:hypothetical protein
MSIVERYLRFAEEEAKGRSPLYHEFARGVAYDRDLIALVSGVPSSQQQPNLLLASGRYLGDTSTDFASFRRFVLDHKQEIIQLLISRRTQTNEVGRAAVLMPAIAQLPGPVALLEVGASAGLCLLLDRYCYHYDSQTVGDPRAVVQLTCQVEGPVPIPERLPEVLWRMGVDLNPLDVNDDDAMRWLESCVWPDQTHRIERLRAAIQIAREDPPAVLQGNLLDLTADVARQAPAEATLVIFHSAVLAYLSAEARARFANIVADLGAVWLSNEGVGVVDLKGVDSSSDLTDHALPFVLTQGSHPLALADPHGARLRWLEASSHGTPTQSGPTLSPLGRGGAPSPAGE